MAVTRVILLVVLLATVHSTASCGPSSDINPVTVLETEPPGYELLNLTEHAGETWQITLKPSANYPSGSELYNWLNDAIYINSTPGIGYHRVMLKYTLDLEFIYENMSQKLSVLTYNLKCEISGNLPTPYEWFVVIVPVNEFAPEFIGAPYNISVPEDTAIDTVLATLRNNATDRDVVTASDSDIHEFNMVLQPLPWTGNMSDPLAMDNKQDGVIKVAESLDFEKFPSGDEAYLVYNITVWDLARWSTTSTFTVHILDVDDKPPYFFYPGCGPPPCEVFYTCEVTNTFTGVITALSPANITARDGDALNYTVVYRIKTGPQSPDYRQYVSIDNTTGVFTVLNPLDVYNKEIFLIIQDGVSAHWQILGPSQEGESRSMPQSLRTIPTHRRGHEAVEVSDKALYKDTTLIIRIYDPYATSISPSTSTPINLGASTDDEGSSRTMVVAISVLAVVVLLAFVVLAVVVLYMKKRHDKPIYPIKDTKVEIVEEVEDTGDEKLERGGSNTDSGQWSMAGVSTPGLHVRSAAPSQTRLLSQSQLSNGRLSKSPASAMGFRDESRMSVDDEPRQGAQTEADLRNDSVLEVHRQPSALSNGVFDNDTPMGFAQLNVQTTEADLDGLGGERMTSSPAYLFTRRLPPLVAPPEPVSGTKTPVRSRSRSSRKQRKEQKLAKLRGEVFDGTKSYPPSADNSFYTEGHKQKVKMSSRKKKAALDLKHWVTVENDYVEI